MSEVKKWVEAGRGSGIEFKEADSGLFIVDSVPRINRRIVVATNKGDGVQVRVKVMDNRNYMVGMELKAWRESDDVWVRPGRGPRRRGVW